MSKQESKEWLENAEDYIEFAICSLQSAKDELEELQSDDDEWNVMADIETEISRLNIVKQSIIKLL